MSGDIHSGERGPAVRDESGLQELMTYSEVAAWLGVPKGTLYAWVHERRVPYVRLGPRMVRFSRRALTAWLAERVVSPDASRCA